MGLIFENVVKRIDVDAQVLVAEFIDGGEIATRPDVVAVFRHQHDQKETLKNRNPHSLQTLTKREKDTAAAISILDQIPNSISPTKRRRNWSPKEFCDAQRERESRELSEKFRDKRLFLLAKVKTKREGRR